MLFFSFPILTMELGCPKSGLLTEDSLGKLVIKNDLNAIQQLIKGGYSINRLQAVQRHEHIKCDVYGKRISITTALFLAVEMNHNLIAQELLEQGADPNIPANYYFWNRCLQPDVLQETPLKKAMQQGNFQLAQLLLKHGALVRNILPDAWKETYLNLFLDHTIKKGEDFTQDGTYIKELFDGWHAHFGYKTLENNFAIFFSHRLIPQSGIVKRLKTILGSHKKDPLFNKLPKAILFHILSYLPEYMYWVKLPGEMKGYQASIIQAYPLAEVENRIVIAEEVLEKYIQTMPKWWKTRYACLELRIMINKHGYMWPIPNPLAVKEKWAELIAKKVRQEIEKV